MKKLCRTLFLLLVLFITACSNDDNVDIDQLAGEWGIINNDPNIPIDFSKWYLFRPDNVCIMYYNSFLDTDSKKDSCIYIVSKDGRLLTIYNRNKYVEQWKITNLSSSKMMWKSLSALDGVSNEELVRSTHRDYIY